MAEPVLLYCVGATKAGTSWLYRALSEHPQTHLRGVKEAHYWDSFTPKSRANQVAALDRRHARLSHRLNEAGGRTGQVERLTRQLAEITALREVLQADREGDAAYAAWLFEGAEDARLVADLTPSYALLPEAQLERMLALHDDVRVIYLMRDPLSRLWSHSRMMAERRADTDETDLGPRANRILRRAVVMQAEPEITERGDYAAAVEKLRRLVPADRLRVEFAERMFTPEGWEDICRFLGLGPHPAPLEKKVHSGPRIEMRDDIGRRAMEYLDDQYRWVAENVGPLPAAWQANLARAEA